MQSYACQLGKKKFVLDRELKPASLSNEPLQSQYQQRQSKKSRIECKICQNWHMRSEFFFGKHKQLWLETCFELTTVLRSLPQYDAYDLVWEG